MAITVNVSRNLSDYLDTTTTAFDMSTGTSKTITLSTGKPYTANDVLEYRPVGQPLPGGIKLTGTTYNSGTGVVTTNATVFGYSDDTPVQSCALAISTINTFTNPGLGLLGGENIRLVRVSTAGSWGTGTVTTYNNTTGAITLNITAVGTTGTFDDLVLVSNGTFSDWAVSYAQSDTINVNNDATLTIDSNTVVPISNITAADRGTILFKNTSTTNLLKVEFSMYTQAVITTSQNSTFKVEGDWIQIGTGNDTAAQTIDISTYDIPYPTFLEVETGSGTGIYEKWNIAVDGVTGDFNNYNCFIPQPVWGTGEMGNVFFYNPDTKVLKVGDGTNGNKIVNGAKVRMPNIYLMGKIPFSYATTTNNTTATGSVLGVVDTRLFSTATNAFTVTIDNEVITLGARTGTNVNMTVRAQFGTIAQTINPGDKIWRRYVAATSGNETGRRTSITGAGKFDVNTAQFFGFYIYADGYQSGIAKNLGCDMPITLFNTTGATEIENYYYAPTNNQGIGFYCDNLKGDLSISKVLMARSVLDSLPTTTNTTVQNYVYRCSSVTKLENISIIDYGMSTTRTGGLYLIQSFTKDPNYKINNIKLIGCYFLIVSCANIKFENIYHGILPNTAPIMRTTSASASSTTDEFTTNIMWTPTTVVPPTGTPLRFIGGTYPTTNPALANGSQRFVVKTSNTTFKIALSYRAALRNDTVDLTTNGGTNIHIFFEMPMATVFNITTSSNLLFNNIYSIGCGGCAQLFLTDFACSNLEVYNVDYNGSYDFQYLFQNQGANFTIKNVKLGEVIPQAVVGAAGGVNNSMTVQSTTGTGTYIENVRASSTGISFSTGSDWGAGYTSNSNYNFLVGNKPLHRTGAGGSAGNMRNVSHFMNLIDVGNSPTTGNLGISSATPSDFITLTGSAYLNNQGRIVFMANGDTATVTASVPIRGITSFQNATPVHTTSTTPGFSYEFRVKTPLGSWSAWADLTGANLSTALSGLTGYDSNEGFLMSVKITASLNAQHFYYVGTMATNIDTNWVAPDAYFAVVGAGATEIVEARKTSDDSLIARRQGPGRIDVSTGVETYFVRKSSGGVTIASTRFEPVTPVLGNNGEVQLYAGSEVQIADATQLVDDVWTKDISAITTPNTAGKVLKDRLSKNQFLGLK